MANAASSAATSLGVVAAQAIHRREGRRAVDAHVQAAEHRQVGVHVGGCVGANTARLPVVHIERVPTAAAEHAVRDVKHHRHIRCVGACLQHRRDVEHPQPQRVLDKGGANQPRIGQQIGQHIVGVRPRHHLLDEVHAEQDPPQRDVRLGVTAASLTISTFFFSSAPCIRYIAKPSACSRQKNALPPSPELLAVGEHLVPQLRRAVQAARRLQPPPLVDLLELVAVLGGIAPI